MTSDQPSTTVSPRPSLPLALANSRVWTHAFATLGDQLSPAMFTAIARVEEARDVYGSAEASGADDRIASAWRDLEERSYEALYTPGPLDMRLAVFAAGVFDGAGIKALLDDDNAGNFYGVQIAKLLLAERGR